MEGAGAGAEAAEKRDKTQIGSGAARWLGSGDRIGDLDRGPGCGEVARY